jgi:hypothetical protein
VTYSRPRIERVLCFIADHMNEFPSLERLAPRASYDSAAPRPHDFASMGPDTTPEPDLVTDAFLPVM